MLLSIQFGLMYLRYCLLSKFIHSYLRIRLGIACHETRTNGRGGPTILSSIAFCVLLKSFFFRRRRKKNGDDVGRELREHGIVSEKAGRLRKSLGHYTQRPG